MLFWITWIIGNLVYVKTYHTQKSFPGPWPRLYKVTFFLIDIQGHIIQKSNFSLPQVSQSDSYLFPLIGAIWTTLGQKFQDNPNLTKTLSFDRNFPSLGNLNPFGPKGPRKVQTWLELCPLTGTSHKPFLIQKNLSRQSELLKHAKSASPYNQGS